VEVAILSQDLEDFAGLVDEKAVVGKDDRCAAALLENRQDVLDEVELLVARRDREVIPLGRLVCALRPEGGVR